MRRQKEEGRREIKKNKTERVRERKGKTKIGKEDGKPERLKKEK